jgi:hypothetical protein
MVGDPTIWGETSSRSGRRWGFILRFTVWIGEKLGEKNTGFYVVPFQPSGARMLPRKAL